MSARFFAVVIFHNRDCGGATSSRSSAQPVTSLSQPWFGLGASACANLSEMTKIVLSHLLSIGQKRDIAHDKHSYGRAGAHVYSWAH